MKQRVSETITIHNGDRDVLVPITPQSRYVYNLMSEHYIILEFVLSEAIQFAIGDWIEDELFGKYYIKDEQMPADDNKTGGYRYQLKFVSWYWMWAQKNMMLVVTLPTGDLYRKETQWHHTNTLAKQLEEVKKNLNALGYSNVNIDISGVEKEGNSFLMSYSGTNICDALTQIANTWECEWWVTGVEDDCTIHFGKCEDGDIIEFENGKNVVTMDINRNCDTYANKFYVFGSKDNVPTTYRQELIITAEEPNDALEYTTDKKLTPSMFSMQVDTELAAVNFPATLTKGTEDDILMLEDLFAWESSLNLNEVIFNKITIKKPTDSGAYIEASIPPVTLGKITVTFNREAEDAELEGVLAPFVGIVAYKVTGDNREPLNEYRYGFSSKKFVINSSTTQSVTTSEFALSSQKLDIVANVELDFLYGVGIEYAKDKNKGSSTRATLDKEASFTVVFTSNANNKSSERIPIKFVDKDSSAFMVVNPGGYNSSIDDSRRVSFYNTIDSLTRLTLSSDEKRFTISDEYAVSVPDAYYQSNYDNSSTLLSVGDNRLQLPIVSELQSVDGIVVNDDGSASYSGHENWVYKDGYIIRKDLAVSPNSARVVEMAICFENIYPDSKMKITKISEEEKQTITIYDDDSKETTKWFQYHVSLAYADGNTFVFKKNYILQNIDCLKIRFLSPSDVPNITTGNCRLAGMTFDVDFSPSRSFVNRETGEREVHEQDFAIVRNDSFGAMLPNEYIRPDMSDPCVLVGWNVKSMGQLNMIHNAEVRLLKKGIEYAEALEENQFTANCQMVSKECFSEDGNEYTIYQLGQKVRLLHSAFKNGFKESRIIGIELKLDMPYDTPKYIVGETDAYSRLKQIEKEITKLS